MIPLALKVGWSAFIAVLVPIYWRRYGPANFLWFSDLALFATAVALWLESPRLASATAVSALLPEIVWASDFLIGLVTRGRTPIGLAAYMFDAALPLWLRGLSLFHLALPPALVFLVARLGYDVQGIRYLIPAGEAVLLATFAFTDPAKNINWVFGPGKAPQTRIPPLAYFAGVMVFFPAAVYLPTHLALSAVFRR